MGLGSKHLSSLQRSTVAGIAATMAISSSLSLEFHAIPSNHFASITYLVIATLGAVPIIVTMFLIGRYLLRETDEYIRSVVIQSLLWGFGLVVVADTILGYMIAFESVLPIHLRTLGIFNMEIFVIATAVALRIRLWSDR